MRVIYATVLAAMTWVAMADSPAEADAVAPGSCPTAFVSRLPRGCRRGCDYRNCGVTFTMDSPCGCPTALPTATLVLPCDEDAQCPYNGCTPAFTTRSQHCPPTSRPTSTVTTSTSTSSPVVITGVTTLPTKTSTTTTSTTSPVVITGVTTLPHSTPCPTVDRTTYPADCTPLRCPVPTCVAGPRTIAVPCGCTVHTRLFVQGCPTECAGGCITATRTMSAVC